MCRMGQNRTGQGRAGQTERMKIGRGEMGAQTHVFVGEVDVQLQARVEQNAVAGGVRVVSCDHALERCGIGVLAVENAAIKPDDFASPPDLLLFVEHALANCAASAHHRPRIIVVVRVRGDLVVAMVRLGLARAALRRRPPRRRLVRLLLLFLRTRAVLGAVLGAIAKHAAVVHHHLLFIQIQRHRQPRVEQHVVLASPRVVPHDSAAHGLDALALDHETRADDVIASHTHPSSRGRAPTPVQTRGRRKIHSGR